MSDAPKHDELTGVETTGHDWDGITELDNPLPKWWLYIFYACIGLSVLAGSGTQAGRYGWGNGPI
ncbi:hypothetical protein JCM17844_15260 [Iodidimonas gelatinilytica]|uniref:Cbb3-type cytochrome c oxidase subunit CcoP N-terminal domain-containing protein n=1 Tax=Iodidimonas gelatinilytica TaxID=1236966 RepID=A0A5A7MSN5_9PROT|nr:cbb3-type cytochrome c oxidase N-terminal domain-containing protein [Iodidimonas gelatinilytica]GEQ97889.1 hypothetical protein JCM17844_15260 [Iodidimonas gelatinilytica]